MKMECKKMTQQLAILCLVIILTSCLGDSYTRKTNSNALNGTSPSENCLDSIQVEIRSVLNIRSDSLLFFFMDSQFSTNPIYMFDTNQVSVLLQSGRYVQPMFKMDPQQISYIHTDSGCSHQWVDSLWIRDTIVIYDTVRIGQIKSEVDRYIHSTPPRIFVDAAGLESLFSPLGGYSTIVPMIVTHFYNDGAELSLLAIPPWATLDTIDLCEGWIDSIFQQQDDFSYITKGVSCTSGSNPSIVLRLSPDISDIGREFEWAIAVSNRFGLRDTLQIKSIPINHKIMNY